jgi:hypothetical protein
MNGIGWALKQMYTDSRVQRAAWPNSTWLGTIRAGAGGNMTEAYVYISTDGKRVPYVCTQADLLALDWQIVPDA